MLKKRPKQRPSTSRPQRATQRLSKVLAAYGVASRRKCEELIFEGRVTVNGEIALLPQTMVDEQRDVLTVDGEKVKGSSKLVYYVLNKPKGYVCTNAPNIKKRAIDLVPGGTRLFTVGRLDKDTEGLIIITNDGHFTNAVIHPSSGIEKEYLAKVDKEITHEHLVAIGRGTIVDGTFVRPLQVRKVRRGTIRITVAEGKKREVRCLLEKAGLVVHSLSRIRIGHLTLGTLTVGQYRILTEAERDGFNLQDNQPA